MKKLLSILLAIATLASLVPAALAEDIVIVEPEIETGEAPAEAAEPEDGLISLVDADEPPEPEEPEEAASPETKGFRPDGDPTRTWVVENADVLKGECGDGVHWELEGSTLTISGEGTMNDFTKYAPGWYANRDSIQSIVIRSGPVNIGVNAFIDCRNVKSVSLSGSVKQIGNWAFEGCASLQSITLTKHIEAIGSGAFAFCTALTEIKVDAGNTVFKSVDGALWSLDGTVLHTYPAGKGGKVTLGAGVLAVFDEAFEGCDKLTGLVCGDDLVYLGLSACYGCTALRSVSLGGNLAAIGAGAFYACVLLPELRIPAGVELIDAYAFSECQALKVLVIPESVTELGANLCENCVSLEHVMIGGSGAIGDSSFVGCSALKSATIGERVTGVGAHAFEGCDALTEIVIPDSVKLIDKSAFSLCKHLTRAVIGNGVKTIGAHAFNKCVRLSELQLGSSIRAIGEGAFAECKNVQEFLFPDTLTTLRRTALSGCVSVKKLRLPAALTTVETGAYPSSRYLKTAGPLGSGCDVEFGWTEEMPDDALWGLGSLTSVILPEELTSIGRYAFSNCDALEHVALSDRVTSIGKDCFFDCDKLKTAGPIGSGCNIEFGWTNEIPDNAFSNSYLNSIIFPEGVKRLGKSAFAHTRLGKIVIPDSVKTIGANCFYDLLPNTYEIVIGKNVRVIGTKAFYTTYLFNGSVSFRGSVPETGEACFAYGTVLGFYPADDETWTEEARRRFGNYWIWEACLDLEGPSPAAVEMSTAGLLLAWEPMDGAEEYELQVNQSNGWATRCTTAETSFLDADVWMNSPYDRYRVRARIGDAWTYYCLSNELVFNPFTDVPSEGKTYEYVAWAYNCGVIRGMTETTFAPNENCSRVQFVMMLWKLFGSPEVEGENPFRDVKGAKTTKAVVWALSRGIINSGERFHPDGNISRVQIVMILWKLAGSPTVNEECPFDDVVGAKTRKAVAWAYTNGITKGTSDTTFSPDRDCTRLQLVVFLYKFHEKHRHLF